MPRPEPQLSGQPAQGRAALRLAGEWSASHSARLEALVASAPLAQGKVTIDLSEVSKLDTFGAWAIETLRRSAQAAGADVAIVGAAAAHERILAQLRRAELLQAPPPKTQPLDAVESLGRSTEGLLAYALAILSMTGRLIARFGAGLRRPKFFRGKSIIHHIDHVGVRATPIIVLITFLIGCIIAQQGLFYFRKFGASDYVVNLVTVLVLRELGVLLVTIMIAGRSGSSYAAEIGSMKMREEVDALRTMGLDPVDLLILPRVIALVVAAPLLTVLGMLSALVGAGFVLWLSGEMAPSIFLIRLHSAATYTDFEVGLIKAPVMAFLVGIVAAIEGLKVKGSAESLGLGATASVVKSIFLVIVLDGFFAVLFTSFGM